MPQPFLHDLTKILFLYLITTMLSCTQQKANNITEVLVIGEGTGATSAAIQSARSGAKTILVTPISWLGGMMTAAGVPAIDGNHQLPAGLWSEFRDSLRHHYGGADSLFTGWVSHTMFEPKVGAHYWKQIAEKEENLSILYNTRLKNVSLESQLWTGDFENENGVQTIKAKILIDGTDLGDVAAKAGATYDLGMDSRSHTGEEMAPQMANDIIQDLTYAAILKDYGTTADKTIPKPEGYNASHFLCSCQQNCQDTTLTITIHPCETMLTYGKLPDGKYMINWPLNGNDYYANLIEKTDEERIAIIAKAKNKTLQFVYYIQTELGYKHLGLATDEFPTPDDLPLLPYHREGRRIHGFVQLNVNHMLRPYDYTLYRTGIAVGDYPIDHHHYEYPNAPEIDFPKVPSFTIPIGSLIPRNIDNLIIADKAISVTNIVNGSSRLQPVIIQIGQVAGLMGAAAAMTETLPKDLDIRMLQEKLLDCNGYLMPFTDVEPDHPHFRSIQKIGATGLLRGKGVPYQWANQTWFYPDSTVLESSFMDYIRDFDSRFKWDIKKEKHLTVSSTIDLLFQWIKIRQHKRSFDKMQLMDQLRLILNKHQVSNDELKDDLITKAELAALLDHFINPFERLVDINGNWISE